MKLTLKNLKTHKDMSEETLCFSATLYADGKKVGRVSNKGCGGCNDYYWENRELGKKVDEWAKQQPTEYEIEKLDQIVYKLISKIEDEKWLKRNCRTKIVFRLKSDKEGDWRLIKASWHPSHRTQLETRYGKENIDRIANEEI